MADYGPPTSVRTEGLSVILVFLGVVMAVGGAAYASPVLQVLLWIVGGLVFIGAWMLGSRAKPRRAEQ